MKTYSCDRCQRTFTKTIEETPSSIIRHDRSYIPEEDDAGHTFQLCDDCIIQFWNWEIHDEDFDKFAESQKKTWEKEGEK